MRASRLATIALAVLASSVIGTPGASAQDVDPLGQVTYDKWCAGCHGVDGRGTGPGAETMLPRPRNFSQALYQVRSTGGGELPTDQDILRVINVGMPGTAMPGWEGILSPEERDALVAYLKSFSRFFARGSAPEPLEFSDPPRLTDETLAEGRAQYEAIECSKCHGDQGRGDGSSSPTLEDDGGHPIRAADLTKNWRFSGGGSVEDIYQRLRTGVDGTPMPNFSDLLDAGVVTDHQLWSVAYYVRSLSPPEPPGVDDVVAATYLQDGFPASVDDPLWESAEPAYIPLAGQIIVKPRWFNPRVAGLWVQALHDGDRVAVRVRWTDPNSSPDPEWADWSRRAIEVMAPKEGGPEEVTTLPDQLLVQFPLDMPEGIERPYFLRGDSRRPVTLWQWQSDRNTVLEGQARGLGTESYTPSGGVSVDASHQSGMWQVMFTRSLVTDRENDLDFVTGRPIPMAFSAWDGDNGETQTRHALSAWYFLFLKEAETSGVYVLPLIAMLLTAGLGLWIVAVARKRANG